MENFKFLHDETVRDEKVRKDLVNRINKIEGQIRGIKNMIESDRYCVEILVQCAAVSAALSSFNKMMIDNHIRTCVKNDLENGNDATIEELVKVLDKFMKGVL